MNGKKRPGYEQIVKYFNAALAAAVVVVGTLALSTGCSNNANQKSLPDPVTNRYLTKMIVFTMPDGFRNVAMGCNGTTGVYDTSRGAYKNSGADVASLPSAVATVKDDPYCAGQPTGGTNVLPPGITIP
jgi:hypothetical protein